MVVLYNDNVLCMLNHCYSSKTISAMIIEVNNYLATMYTLLKVKFGIVFSIFNIAWEFLIFVYLFIDAISHVYYISCISHYYYIS